MNRREKNQVKCIANAADDFYTAVKQGGDVNKEMKKMFNALDDWRGDDPVFPRRESIEVVSVG